MYYKDKAIYTIKSLFKDERKIKRRTIELRRIFLRWLREDVSSVELGIVSPKWILIIWAILFPIEFMLIRFNDKFGYSFDSHSINIHGVKYSMNLFEHMRFAPVSETFQVEQRTCDYDDTVMVQLKSILLSREIRNVQEMNVIEIEARRRYGASHSTDPVKLKHFRDKMAEECKNEIIETLFDDMNIVKKSDYEIDHKFRELSMRLLVLKDRK